jgi:hypothetical protein
VKAKDIEPGVVYALQRGRGEYASVQAVVLLAPADKDHIYRTASRYRDADAPAFLKANAGAKPGRGKYVHDAPDLGYPAAIGEPEALKGVTLADFEASTTGRDHERGVGFVVLTSLTNVVGPYEEAVARLKAAEDARRAERDEAERVRVAKAARSQKLVVGLAAHGVDARPHAGSGLVLSLDDVEKVLGLLPAAEQKENQTDA